MTRQALSIINEYSQAPNMNRKQASFYGKANVICTAEGEFLESYTTIVCMITGDGEFKRLWDGWSATTAKHIDSFRKDHGLNYISKAEWIKLPVQEWK